MAAECSRNHIWCTFAAIIVVISYLCLPCYECRIMDTLDDGISFPGNLKFELNDFSSDKGLVLSGLVPICGKEHFPRSNPLVELHYNLTCKVLSSGKSNCTVESRSKEVPTLAKVHCSVKNIRVCDSPTLKYCHFEGVIMVRNESNFTRHSNKFGNWLLSSVPPLPVRQLHIQNKSANEVLLAWMHPRCRFVNFEYYISVKQKGVLIKEIKGTPVLTRGPMTIFHLQGLEPFTTYHICIWTRKAAHLDDLQSPMACTVGRTMEGVPFKPPTIKHLDVQKVKTKLLKATIYWQGPPASSLNGRLLRYEVWYADKKNLNHWEHKIVPIPQEHNSYVQYTLEALFADKEYTVKVRAVTGGGTIDSRQETVRLNENESASHNVFRIAVGTSVGVLVLLAVLGLVGFHLRNRNRQAGASMSSLLPRDDENLRDHMISPRNLEYARQEDVPGIYSQISIVNTDSEMT